MDFGDAKFVALIVGCGIGGIAGIAAIVYVVVSVAKFAWGD